MALFLRGLCLLAGYLFGGFDSGGRGAVHGGRQCAGYWHRQPRHGEYRDILVKRPGCWFCRATSSRLRRPAGSATSLRRSWGLPLCCTAVLARFSGTTGRFGTRAGAARAWPSPARGSCCTCPSPVCCVVWRAAWLIAADRLSAGRRGADCRAGCAGGLAAIRHRGWCCTGPECRYHGHAALGRSAADTSRRGLQFFRPKL